MVLEGSISEQKVGYLGETPPKIHSKNAVCTYYNYNVKRVLSGKRYPTHGICAKIIYLIDRNGARRLKFFIENNQRKEIYEVDMPKGFILWLANGIRKDHKINNILHTVRIAHNLSRPIWINPDYEHLFQLRKYKDGKRPVGKIK